MFRDTQELGERKHIHVEYIVPKTHKHQSNAVLVNWWQELESALSGPFLADDF